MKLSWQHQLVEVIDLAPLAPGWRQVVIRVVDKPRRPVLSLREDDLLAGRTD
jgi:hypothetical protein